MKALFVTPYPPKPDGIGEHTRGLVDALAAGRRRRRRGADPRGPAADGAMPRRAPAALRRSPVHRARRRPDASGCGPDVLHYQFAIPAFGLAACRPSRPGSGPAGPNPDLRIVITLHEVRREIDLLGPVGGRIYRALVATADARHRAHHRRARSRGAGVRRRPATGSGSRRSGAAPPPVGQPRPRRRALGAGPLPAHRARAGWSAARPLLRLSPSRQGDRAR